MPQADGWLRPAFEAIAIDDEGRACRDIPESACKEEAGNFFIHAASLSLSKSADGFIDPKLVLSWLMTTLGAPASLIGLLVPVREAGALLPQMFTAGFLRRLPQRKWAWAAGAAAQGAAALLIALIAVSLSGAAAGWAIVGALAALAIARSVCSVSYKDVLGKTVDKSRRGRATGLAASAASVAVIVFGVALSTDVIDRMTLVLGGLVLAGAAWVSAALLFTRLAEAPGATEGGKASIDEAIESAGYLKTDKQLRRFILVRGLLIATALAPPFMVSAASTPESAYADLGYLLLASAGASLVSSFVWGRLADRSSRRVLVYASAAGGIALLASAGLAFAGVLGGGFFLPALIFVLMIAYQGVRLGRSTHLVDMADEETRAPYTALSNTVIGVLLLAGGVFSVVAQFFGAAPVLALMALMCIAAIPAALGLEEVQS